jgi:hypothetical protein
MKTNLLKLMALIRLLILVGALAGGVNVVLAEESEKAEAKEEQKADADEDEEEDEEDDEDENEDN